MRASIHRSRSFLKPGRIKDENKKILWILNEGANKGAREDEGLRLFFLKAHHSHT
jgi:hypothetical protein